MTALSSWPSTVKPEDLETKDCHRMIFKYNLLLTVSHVEHG